MKITLTTTINTSQPPITENSEPYYRYQFCISSKKLGEDICSDLITNHPLIPQLALIATLKGSIPQYNYTIDPQITERFYEDPQDDCLELANTSESYNELLNLINTYNITQDDINQLYNQLNQEGLLDHLYWVEPNDETFQLNIDF